MTVGRFIAARPDGRSDRRVLFDLTEARTPETVITYEEMTAALSAGLPAPVDRGRVYRAVAAANKVLLEERRRYLKVVANVGYKVLRTDEHLPVALEKKDRAQSYISKGIALLRHANLDELTGVQRTLHEGQLIVLAGLHQAVQESTARHNRQEQVIDELRRRVEKLEGDQ